MESSFYRLAVSIGKVTPTITQDFSEWDAEL